MIFAFLAPEVLLGAAVIDLLSAMTSVMDMRDLAGEDGVEWQLGHAFLANMGGFAVRFDDVQNKASLNTMEDLTDGEKLNAPNKIAEGTDPSAEPPIRCPCLWLDEEIIHNEYIDGTNVDISGLADEATFSSFSLVWGSKRRKRMLDAMASLSTLAEKNKSQPWNTATGMGWKPHPQNVLAIKKGLSKLKNSPVEFVMPLYLNLAALQGNIWILDARQLYYARKCGLIDLPDISEEELGDRSKGDTLVKSIALLEITWLVIGLVARRVRGHPSTQLEVMTLALAACSMITYCFLICKPKDVAVPITIGAKRYPKPSEVLTLANFGPTPWFDIILFEKWTTGRTRFWMPNTACHYVDYKSNWLRIEWNRHGVIWIGAVVGTSILGGLHTLAWESTFPTRTEEVGWRLASILTMAIPWAYLILGNCFFSILILFARRIDKTNRDSNGNRTEFGTESNPFSFLFDTVMRFPNYVRVHINSYYATISFFAISVYIAARLFLVVEAFRSLGFLPSAAYIATWI